MAVERNLVDSLTMEELKVIVAQIVDERLEQVQIVRPTRKRSTKEVLESIERNRWTPPPGAPTSLELLREDRDQ